nr:hypothetical protein [Methylomonas koyamae]
MIREYITMLDGSITGSTMSTEQVKARLLSKKGIHYDPQVVDTFLAVLEETRANDERPVIEISWTQLQAGMEAAEVLCNDVLYLKDQILTDKHVEDILGLRKHGKSLVLRVRLGQGQGQGH